MASIAAWVTSPELAELVGHFGGQVPDGPLGSVLDRVAEFSRSGTSAPGSESGSTPTRVDYGHDLDARLRSLIRTLGLDGRHRPTRERYDHVVVLGGGIRVTLGRTDYAARLPSASNARELDSIDP